MVVERKREIERKEGRKRGREELTLIKAGNEKDDEKREKMLKKE